MPCYSVQVFTALLENIKGLTSSTEAGRQRIARVKAAAAEVGVRATVSGGKVRISTYDGQRAAESAAKKVNQVYSRMTVEHGLSRKGSKLKKHATKTSPRGSIKITVGR